MTIQLQQVITAVRALSAREKLELLQVLSQDLQQTYNFAEANAQFWSNQSIESIAAAQSAPIVTDLDRFVADFWPEEESADDINNFIAAQRRADRVN